jgi:HPt (histidine-containing phosphotransfer) domain-containing protein
MAGNNKSFEIDMSYLSDIAGGSEEFMIEMIDIFIEQTPLYFEQLEEAVNSRDWKAVGDVAHKIKPTLAFMGIEEAKDIMADIERKARINGKN